MEQGYWALVISEDVSGENACLLAEEGCCLGWKFFVAVLIVGEKKQEAPRLSYFVRVHHHRYVQRDTEMSYRRVINHSYVFEKK